MTEYEKKKELLLTIQEYIEEINTKILKIALHIQQGEEAKGIELLVELTSSFEEIIEAINLTNDILKESIDTKEINEKFDEINEAINEGDYILIADLLQYEIVEILNAWKEKTKEVQEH